MLSEIKDNQGARKGRIRVGRGIGSTKGKTCGRGGKGQTARSGVRIKGFEGGQTPIHRRLPKRGFNQRNSVEYSVINLADLQVAIDDGKLDAKAPITVALLVENNIVRKSVYGVKLLGRGELKASVTIEVDAASASAVAGVEKVGGKITIAA